MTMRPSKRKQVAQPAINNHPKKQLYKSPNGDTRRATMIGNGINNIMAPFLCKADPSTVIWRGERRVCKKKVLFIQLLLYLLDPHLVAKCSFLLFLKVQLVENEAG